MEVASWGAVIIDDNNCFEFTLAEYYVILLAMTRDGVARPLAGQPAIHGQFTM